MHQQRLYPSRSRITRRSNWSTIAWSSSRRSRSPVSVAAGAKIAGTVGAFLARVARLATPVPEATMTPRSQPCIPGRHERDTDTDRHGNDPARRRRSWKTTS